MSAGRGSNQYQSRGHGTPVDAALRREVALSVESLHDDGSVAIYGQATRLIPGPDGGLRVDPSEETAAAFRDRTWVDEGLGFVLSEYKPSLDDLGPGGLVDTAVGLFQPEFEERMSAAKRLIEIGDAPRAVWERILHDVENGFLTPWTSGLPMYWYQQPGVPHDVRTRMLVLCGSDVDYGKVSERLDVEDLTAVVTQADIWPSMAAGEMLKLCRGEVAAAFIGPEHHEWVREAAVRNSRLPEDAVARVCDDPNVDVDVVEAALRNHLDVRLTRQQWKRLVRHGAVDHALLVRCTNMPWLIRRRLSPWHKR